MAKYYTEPEITARLKDITIICDTREQVNGHVTDWFSKNGVAAITRKLDTGDYSALLGEETMEREVVVERKANIDELCGNMTADRDRFEREFTRAKADGLKVFLLVEESSWADILSHNYKSKMEPRSLWASLLSWQARFNVTIIMCRKAETGRIIYGTLYYWIREKLKRGEI